MTIKFTTTSAEADLIGKILDRVDAVVAKHGGVRPDRMTAVMDLSAAHANGCPMDFDRLYAADDFNLLHDVFGIRRHIDRTTGKIGGCFLPRFAKACQEGAGA